MKPMLNIALPKGRLGEKVYGMFETAGFPCPSIKENNRKLIFENGQENEHLATVRDTLLPKLMNGEIDVSTVQI